MTFSCVIFSPQIYSLMSDRIPLQKAADAYGAVETQDGPQGRNG